MYAAIRRHYYWESMAADEYDWMASCASCSRSSMTTRRRTAMLKLFLATDPFASLSMVLLGALTETRTENVFLLIIVDRFSKLFRAVDLARFTATDVSSAFFRDWISVYGPPDTVLRDNGPQFASLFFKGVCNLMGIRNLYTSMYHPHTNGQVECFNETLVDVFMHYIEDHQDNWDELVIVLALAYNSRPHRTTGVAPMDLVTPRRLRNFSLERMPDGMTPDPSQSVAEAKTLSWSPSRPCFPKYGTRLPRHKPGTRGTMTRKSALAGYRCPVVTGCTYGIAPGSTGSTPR